MPEEKPEEKLDTALPEPGEYLRLKRDALGLTIQEVVDEIRADKHPESATLDRPRLFRIEKGERPMPDWLYWAYIRALRRIVRRHAAEVGLRIQAGDAAKQPE